jgi:hypothetical protein
MGVDGWVAGWISVHGKQVLLPAMHAGAGGWPGGPLGKVETERRCSCV